MKGQKKIYSGGLVITRKVGEAIYIKVKDHENEVIRIDVRRLTSNQVRVGIMADAELIEIRRAECVEDLGPLKQ